MARNTRTKWRAFHSTLVGSFIYRGAWEEKQLWHTHERCDGLFCSFVLRLVDLSRPLINATLKINQKGHAIHFIWILHMTIHLKQRLITYWGGSMAFSMMQTRLKEEPRSTWYSSSARIKASGVTTFNSDWRLLIPPTSVVTCKKYVLVKNIDFITFWANAIWFVFSVRNWKESVHSYIHVQSDLRRRKGEKYIGANTNTVTEKTGIYGENPIWRIFQEWNKQLQLYIRVHSDHKGFFLICLLNVSMHNVGYE